MPGVSYHIMTSQTIKEGKGAKGPKATFRLSAKRHRVE